MFNEPAVFHKSTNDYKFNDVKEHLTHIHKMFETHVNDNQLVNVGLIELIQ